MKGKLVLVIGPSGSGKGALIQHVRETHPGILYPTSCTTRAPRPGEKDGDVYYFLSNREFDRRIDEGAFLEWASYGGNRYGTLEESITGPLREGKVLLRELEVQGALQLLKRLPRENIVLVFIDAGPWEALEARIKNRAPISDEELALRKARYEAEIAFKENADYVISNQDGELEKAKVKFDGIIREIKGSTVSFGV